jgi:hypothetical protein
MGMTIVLADNLHRALSDLDGAARKRVVDFLIKLQTEPHSSGVRLKSIKNPRDPRVRTARVTDNLRAVLLHIGESMYVVQTVLRHDDAYRYAEQITLSVNKATGAVEALETARIEARVHAVVSAPPAVGAGSAPLLAHVSNHDFDHLGLPAELVPALRRIDDEEGLFEFVEPLPALQRDVILSLVDRPPEQVYAEIVAPAAGPARIEPDNLAAALERPVNRATYLVVTDAAELADALAWPMDRWRIYLHPTQRGLAYPIKPYSGPVRVTGGPGTGKTVVAVHRARALADAAGADERILLTTYGSTLIKTLDELLCRLGGDKARRRVDVLTIDKLARDVLREASRKVNVIGDSECLALLRVQASEAGTGLDPQLLLDEWDSVVLDHDLTTRDAYLAAPRRRMRRLARPQKEAAWTVLERFADYLTRNSLLTFGQVTVEATRVAAQQTAKPYRYVVVDEAQDMTAPQWRLLRAVVPNAPDDMFIVGDAHQRIYDSHAILSHQGIHTRGRGRRLTVSYRTTREIVRSGLALVKGHHYDDLDQGVDSLDGYRSLLRGPAPEAAGYPTLAAELGAVADRVAAWHSAGVPLADIAVGVRIHTLAEKVTETLRERGIAAEIVRSDGVAPDHAVHVMTLHRLKGLEYRCVAVAGLRDGIVPPTNRLAAAADDPHARRVVQEQERALVFVACTRAREALHVSWHGAPSPLIAPLIVQSGSAVAAGVS